MTYVTSTPIKDGIIEYYLALLPGVIPSHARARLTLVSVDDSTSATARPRSCSSGRGCSRTSAAGPQPRALPPDRVQHDRPRAGPRPHPRHPDVRLGPAAAELGTKSGCRRLFARRGRPAPARRRGAPRPGGVVDAITSILAERPGTASMIVKLNDGVSGNGNATVDLRGLDGRDVRELVAERVARARAGVADPHPGRVLGPFARDGGIVEERVTGTELRSPSVQLRVLPDGQVELLSTHDQLLGGPSGQRYLGCTFPADPRTRD